jgi:hypothetical protein
MEHSYLGLFAEAWAEALAALGAILADFAPGDYAVSTNAFPVDQWQAVGGALVRVQTEGVGVWPVRERAALEAADEPAAGFAWRNAHYAATISADGVVRVGGSAGDRQASAAGALEVYHEKGDTYSDERGELLGRLEPAGGVRLRERSAHHALLGFSAEWRNAAGSARAEVWLGFDETPVITWELELETRGTDLRVEMVFATGLAGARHAGMPFDLARRPARDEDLLPAQPPAALARVLLGQREVGAVETFPFQEYVVLSEGEAGAAVLARGLHAYRADQAGTVRLTLSRSVEWLTRGDLASRVGDAGPFFYVPEARGERTVRHVVGAAFGRFAPDGLEVQAMNAAFQNSPLVVRAQGGGTETAWAVLREAAPLSSLSIEGGQALARFFNPTPRPLALAQTYARADVWGNVQGTAETLGPGEIATVVVPVPLPPVAPRQAHAAVECLAPPRWRVSQDQGRPDPAVLARLEAKARALGAQSTEVKAAMDGTEGNERLRLLHRCYVLRREAVEAEFSLLLNRKRLEGDGATSADAVDPEVAALGLRLNQLRIKRRIFDYVAQALAD